ncbi:MAG: hypothetical protein ACYC96_00925 [Fimbriimonadaceae bacterium]
MNRLFVGACPLLLALATPCIAMQGAAGKDYFTVRGTGFAFVLPPSWKVKTTKLEQMLTIPTAAKHGPAVMHFYTVDYRYKTSDWQDTQIAVAGEFKRSIDRQWQEEILGIPLALTKTSGVDAHGVPDVVLTGLLYSATKNKMLFRLTCSAEDFDVANAAWREAFQTLRTTDGSTPEPDDPTKRLSKTELEAKPPAPLPVTILGSGSKSPKLIKGSVVVAGTAGGKHALIRLPLGWSASVQKDGSWLVSAHELSGPMTMSLASTLDSDPASTALLKLSANSLNQFVSVKDRTDIQDKLNKAGGLVNAVYRQGVGVAGPITSFEAAVDTGDLYVLFHWQSAGPLTPIERHALDVLLSEATIDVRP